MKTEGLEIPPKVEQAIVTYRMETDIIGDFLNETIVKSDGKRLQTSEIYSRYSKWSKSNGYRPMNNKGFIGELRKRYEIRRDGKRGNEILDVEYA